MTELKKKITELGETLEHCKSKVIETKQEKDSIAFKADTLRKENENLRELIKLKDGQIQDNVQFEANFKQDREKLQKENKELKHFIAN
jgi:chromosome segregation ATPase